MDMRQDILNYARIRGVFLKVYNRDMLRAIRFSDDDGAMCGNDGDDEEMTGTTDFRGKARAKYLEPLNRELLMKATDPDSDICKAHKGAQNVALDYARSIACLHGQNEGLVCVLALKPGRDGTDIVGLVFYHDWDEGNEMKWRDDPQPGRMTELELVCAKPNSGVGRLLVAYALWDTYRRKLRGGHKYHGCALNVALATVDKWHKLPKEQRYEKYRELAQKHDGYKLYTDFGFRERRLLIKDGDQYVPYETADLDARGNEIARTKHEEYYLLLCGEEFKQLPETVHRMLQLDPNLGQFCSTTHGQKCL